MRLVTNVADLRLKAKDFFGEETTLIIRYELSYEGIHMLAGHIGGLPIPYETKMDLVQMTTEYYEEFRRKSLVDSSLLKRYNFREIFDSITD